MQKRCKSKKIVDVDKNVDAQGNVEDDDDNGDDDDDDNGDDDSDDDDDDGSTEGIVDADKNANADKYVNSKKMSMQIKC